MDDQRKDHMDPEGRPQRTHPKLLQIHNLPVDDGENIKSTNKGRDLQLTDKLQVVPWGTERIPPRIQRHRRVTSHRSVHPQWEQDQTEKYSYGLCWQQKEYDMVPQSWIINCLKMYKISDEVINFMEKTIKTRRVELTAGGRSLAEAKVRKGVFQGDALSPL